MPHNPLTRDFTRKLAKLDGFAELVEETLIVRAATLDAELSAKAENFPEEQRQEFFEAYSEDYVELADELPTILRYSVLTAADTALEAFLNDTCETYAELHKASVRLNDLKGAGIQRSREYLKKVARVPFPDEKSIWTTIIRLHDLRNCIIHADGFVAVSRQDLRQWSQAIAGLRVPESGVIYLEREFTKTIITSYEAFSEVFDESCEGLELWRSVFPFDDA